MLTLNTIHTGDARELAKEIPDGSVDLIFTDPPYLKQYLPLYEWLAQESTRLLTPDGFTLCYTGDYWLADIIPMLNAHLQYYCAFAAINAGYGQMHWKRRVVCRHKAILAYHRKETKPHPRCNVLSTWTGSGQDKRFHIWQQDESTARYYIDCFSSPGQLVLDPFAGSGTTMAMCKLLNRQYIGIELDQLTAQGARIRVANTQELLTAPSQADMFSQ